MNATVELSADDLFELKLLCRRLEREMDHGHQRAESQCFGVSGGCRLSDEERDLHRAVSVLQKIERGAR
jgi:hypothetical protein